jgi:hypothetical protein
MEYDEEKLEQMWQSYRNQTDDDNVDPSTVFKGIMRWISIHHYNLNVDKIIQNGTVGEVEKTIHLLSIRQTSVDNHVVQLEIQMNQHLANMNKEIQEIRQTVAVYIKNNPRKETDNERWESQVIQDGIIQDGMSDAEIVKQDEDDSSGRFYSEPDGVLRQRLKGFVKKDYVKHILKESHIDPATGVNRYRAYLAAGYITGLAERLKDDAEKELVRGGGLVLKYLLDEYYEKLDKELKDKEETKLHDRRIEDYTGR